MAAWSTLGGLGSAILPRHMLNIRHKDICLERHHRTERSRRPLAPDRRGRQTVSGTAVTDWLDDKDKGNTETTAEEGKVEYRKSEEFRKKQAE